MDREELVKTIFQSRTIRWLVGAGVAALCRLLLVYFAIEVPEDVRIEAALAGVAALEAVGLVAISGAAWFRLKAKAIIAGWAE
jgi:hypothetical protein